MGSTKNADGTGKGRGDGSAAESFLWSRGKKEGAAGDQEIHQEGSRRREIDGAESGAIKIGPLKDSIKNLRARSPPS